MVQLKKGGVPYMSKNPFSCDCSVVHEAAVRCVTAKMLSDADFAALCKRVERSGIRCEACNNFFPGRIRLTGPDVDEQAIRAYYAKALEHAATLGVKSIVFGSAGAKRVPEGFDMDRAYQQVVQVTRETGEAAAKYGITIVIEPVRMPDCNIINTFAEGVQLVVRGGAPLCDGFQNASLLLRLPQCAER